MSRQKTPHEFDQRGQRRTGIRLSPRFEQILDRMLLPGDVHPRGRVRMIEILVAEALLAIEDRADSDPEFAAKLKSHAPSRLSFEVVTGPSRFSEAVDRARAVDELLESIE